MVSIICFVKRSIVLAQRAVLISGIIYPNWPQRYQLFNSRSFISPQQPPSYLPGQQFAISNLPMVYNNSSQSYRIPNIAWPKEGQHVTSCGSTHLSQIFWYTTIEIHARHCRASASVTVYIVHLYAECRKN